MGKYKHRGEGQHLSACVVFLELFISIFDEKYSSSSPDKAIVAFPIKIALFQCHRLK